MISREQFDIQINRLVDTFGEKAFSEQRTYMIWRTVEGLAREAVLDIVDNFIRCSKYAPLPAEFSEAVNKKGGRGKEYLLGEMRPKEMANCLDCADSGFIRLFRNREFESWAKYHMGSAPCHCARGALAIDAAKRKTQTDLGAQFSDRWLTSYSIMRPYDDSDFLGSEQR